MIIWAHINVCDCSNTMIKQARHARILQNVTRKEWLDWRWQMRNRITTVDQLNRSVPNSNGSKNCGNICAFPMAITPYYAALIDPANADCPIRLQSVPQIHELHAQPYEHDDPLGERVHSPVRGIIHRYPDRVVLLVTNQCAVFCRHCFRGRALRTNTTEPTKKQISRCIAYIRKHKQVRDVLISGGDPLLLGDGCLEHILGLLRAIPHVEIIRIGSRVPVVLPQRITKDLARMLKRFHPLYLNTHFNHPREITIESSEACSLLADAGIPIGNQTVLLRKINDDSRTMIELVQKLLKIRVKPYYIHQCDLGKGLSHFRVPLSRGVEIIRAIQGHTSGMAVPMLVVDLPGGKGKVPVMPQYIVRETARKTVFRTFRGEEVPYPKM